MFLLLRAWAAYAVLEKLENRIAISGPCRWLHRRAQLSHAAHSAPGKIRRDDAAGNDAGRHATRADRSGSDALVADL